MASKQLADYEIRRGDKDKKEQQEKLVQDFNFKLSALEFGPVFALIFHVFFSVILYTAHCTAHAAYGLLLILLPF